MDLSRSNLTSLDTVELVLALEALSEVEMSEDQLRRIAPFLVSPRQASWVSNSFRRAATVIAVRAEVALGVDEAGRYLVLGLLKGKSGLESVTCYKSLELAIRAFTTEIEAENGI